MRRVGTCRAIEANVTDEPEKNPGPEQAIGPQPAPDPHAELMRQIRRALILEGGLGGEGPGEKGGFDPYNNRLSLAGDRWRVRRRD